MIEDNSPSPQQNANLDTLQHRRDVAGLTTMYKIQQQHVPQLQSLRLPLRQPVHTTRTVERTPVALEEPRCHTSHLQRQFLPRYCKMWNALLSANINILMNNTVHSFKCKANSWLKTRNYVTV